ncbi:MAG TPA: phosphoribosylformylglycinamidine synthase subunit PurQ, partial [Gemmatimonadales bacterium]
ASLPVRVRVEQTDTPFTSEYERGAIVSMPVAHGEGRYVAPDAVLRELEGEGRVVLRYVDLNPNGSMSDIAGVTNAEHNVVGLMPHPERVADARIRQTDGAKVFESIVKCVGLSRGGTR